MQKKQLFLVILAGLILVFLAVAVTAGGKEKRYDFGGRTITYATWWETKPQPGRSEREDLRLKREAEVARSIMWLTIYYLGRILAKYLTTVRRYRSRYRRCRLLVLSDTALNNFASLSSLGVLISAPKFQSMICHPGRRVYGYEIGRSSPGVIFFNKHGREELPIYMRFSSITSGPGIRCSSLPRK